MTSCCRDHCMKGVKIGCSLFDQVGLICVSLCGNSKPKK